MISLTRILFLKSHISIYTMIRSAVLEDLVSIKEMVKKILPEFGFHFDALNSEADLTYFQSYYNGLMGDLFVRENRGEIVGMIALLYVEKHRFKIRKFYVCKEHRNLGIGQELLKYVVRHARKKRAKELFLETSSKMERANRLYQKFGFKKVAFLNIDSDRCDLVYHLNI